MTLLNWEVPKRARPTKDHNTRYQSDSGVAGTYVPNMSKEDVYRWKAKLIRGGEPRVEIRTGRAGALVLLVVRNQAGHPHVTMSANGKMEWTSRDWSDMYKAVAEAYSALLEQGDVDYALREEGP